MDYPKPCTSPTPSSTSTLGEPTLRALCIAAVATNAALEAAHLEHIFIGGFALALLGSERPTYAVDVEVRKRRFSSGLLERVRLALGGSSSSDFELSQNMGWLEKSKDVLSVRHLPTGAIVNLSIRGASHLFTSPPQATLLGRHTLPLPQSHVLLHDKILCTAERFSRTDLEDVFFLFRHRCKPSDLAWIRDAVSKATVRKALATHQGIGPIFQNIGLIR